MLCSRPFAAARARAAALRLRLEAADPGLKLDLADLAVPGGGEAPEVSAEDARWAEGLRASLRARQVLLAVHSLRELPSESPPGILLAAVMTREDPRTALVSRPRQKFAELAAGARVLVDAGHGELRLRAVRPELVAVGSTSPVEARVAAVAAGAADAALVPLSDLVRAGYRLEASEILPMQSWLPVAAQGAWGVEIHAGERELADLLRPLDHLSTRWCTTAELQFQRGAQRARATALAAYCEVRDMNLLLRGELWWQGAVRAGAELRPPERLDGLGEALVAKLLAGPEPAEVRR